MKKTAYYYLSLAAIVAGGLTSCQDEDLGYTAEQIKYETEFVKEFGKPDPNHKWGFVDMPLADVSGNSVTRVGMPNANEWGYMGLDVPYPLSQTQKTYVTNWFKTHRNPEGVAVSWTDYFAQQVYSSSYGNHMDQILDAGHGGTDHIYNYNNGDCSVNGNVTGIWILNESGNPLNQNGWIQYSDKIQYMTGQSTRDFAYHETVSQKWWYDHYVIIPGEMIDPENELASQTTTVKDCYGEEILDRNGNAVSTTESIWGMWFVAFDYEANKDDSDNDDVARNYYFDDWIIRISPGTYSTKSQRVMCEDLGGSFDWDFNDVVFDAYITGWGNNREAHIVVQCAGGTLPIIVGTNDESYEAHSLFGVETSEVVIRPQAPAQYTIDLPNGQGNTTNVSAIPIYVDGNNIAEDIQLSNVPQRFACPTTVDWQDELKCITKKYPRFPDWAQDQNTQNVWEMHPENHPYHNN